MSGSNNSSNMSFENKFKLKAIDLAKQIGYRAAGRELKISEGNIRRWAKIEDKIQKASRTACIVEQRRRAKYPEIDRRVCSYIEAKRNDGLQVSRSLIRLEALKTAKDLGIVGPPVEH